MILVRPERHHLRRGRGSAQHAGDRRHITLKKSRLLPLKVTDPRDAEMRLIWIQIRYSRQQDKKPGIERDLRAPDVPPGDAWVSQPGRLPAQGSEPATRLGIVSLGLCSGLPQPMEIQSGTACESGRGGEVEDGLGAFRDGAERPDAGAALRVAALHQNARPGCAEPCRNPPPDAVSPGPAASRASRIGSLVPGYSGR